MRVFAATIVILAGWALLAAGAQQTDWAGGPVAGGPVSGWQDGFESAAGLSWRSVPGQLALTGRARETPQRHYLATMQYGALGIDSGDLDGDGDVDIVGAASRLNRLTIWLNDGGASPAFTAVVLDASFLDVSGVFVSDLDRDGDLDVVACSGQLTGQVRGYLNDDGVFGSWTVQIIDEQWGEAWEIGVDDVDADGWPDVIGPSASYDAVVWWHNDGQDPIGWTRQQIGTLDGAHTARAGDLNGDGRPDVVSTGTRADGVKWWRNEGGDPVVWTEFLLDADFDGGRSVRIADIDGDGDQDVAAAGFNNRMQWWSNEGGDPVVWSTQIVDESVSQLHHLQVVDLNGDGLLDLAAASFASNTLVWWENGGGSLPITWTQHRSGLSMNRPLAVHAGDVDGDGALELLGSSNGGSQFQWYDITWFEEAGSLTSSVLDAGSAMPLRLDWNADVPPGTELGFQVRRGDAPDALGDWSVDLTSPGALEGEAGRYLQYRVAMASADSALSPVLYDLEFSPWAAAAPSPGAVARLEAFPNPANPRARIFFELERAAVVRLEVVDARGRRLRTLADRSFAAGRHDVVWDGADEGGAAAASGVYLVRMITPDAMRLTRITLLR